MKYIILLVVAFLGFSKYTMPNLKESDEKDSISLYSKEGTKATRVAWYEEKLSIEDEKKTYELILNEKYINDISEPEKAVLGYIATVFDRECNWGEATGNGCKLHCKIISALNLGAKCSTKHLDFLHKWYDNDSKVIEVINLCTTEPNLNTRQVILKEIFIEREKNRITTY